MELYTVKNTKTGELYPWVSVNKEKLSKTLNDDEVIVALRAEPTEPCWRCRDSCQIDVTWNLCPNCGRRLRKEPE